MSYFILGPLTATRASESILAITTLMWGSAVRWMLRRNNNQKELQNSDLGLWNMLNKQCYLPLSPIGWERKPFLKMLQNST
jgi:hypothetical protein